MPEHSLSFFVPRYPQLNTVVVDVSLSPGRIAPLEIFRFPYRPLPSSHEDASHGRPLRRWSIRQSLEPSRTALRRHRRQPAWLGGKRLPMRSLAQMGSPRGKGIRRRVSFRFGACHTNPAFRASSSLPLSLAAPRLGCTSTTTNHLGPGLRASSRRPRRCNGLNGNGNGERPRKAAPERSTDGRQYCFTPRTSAPGVDVIPHVELRGAPRVPNSNGTRDEAHDCFLAAQVFDAHADDGAKPSVVVVNSAARDANPPRRYGDRRLPSRSSPSRHDALRGHQRAR